MYLHRILFVLSLVACMVGKSAATQQVVPSALLTIDQNRSTVIERIVGEWGDRLASSNAGIGPAQLREILGSLRADALLAASLAGSLDGLRDVVATSLTSNAPVRPDRVSATALGSTNIDLVYTPVVPCRILDTRYGTTPPYNAQMAGGVAFPVAAMLANFSAQGGSATSCNLVRPFQAIAVTFTVLNPNFDAFLAASNTSNFATLTQSVVMDFSANRGLANTAIVPVDPTGMFFLGLPAQVTTHVIADAVGYFTRPTNYGGTHTITGTYATDSGGLDNASTAYAATVAGGESNTASGSDSNVGGGANNTASGTFSTIAGGRLNSAAGLNGTVGGGYDNRAQGAYSTVAGGTNNLAPGEAASVAGGAANAAEGRFSTVAGGAQNSAIGEYSFAAGRAAIANRDGCFVFANWSSLQASSCLGNTNIARFALDHGLSIDFASARNDGSGTRWLYIGDLNAGNTIVAWNNATLTDAGVWVNGSSSKTSKIDFAAVDVQDVLAKVARLPITSWRYKQGEGNVRHMGPMAEDFWAAFNIGYGDHTIADLDARGVTLAAIQGLNQTLRKQMQQKDREILQLKHKLRVIEAKLGL